MQKFTQSQSTLVSGFGEYRSTHTYKTGQSMMQNPFR